MTNATNKLTQRQADKIFAKIIDLQANLSTAQLFKAKVTIKEIEAELAKLRKILDEAGDAN